MKISSMNAEAVTAGPAILNLNRVLQVPKDVVYGRALPVIFGYTVEGDGY